MPDEHEYDISDVMSASELYEMDQADEFAQDAAADRAAADDEQ
ncbi:hypothetical protein [Streptomyces sp. H27-H5]|nr:hypothetical protein [Streptomyces sp. H27-H5]MCY0960854.1 hypothetical protein [Streptomyces sp. H27-H5]